MGGLLFWRKCTNPGLHAIATDYAGIVIGEVFSGSIRVLNVHISGCLLVAHVIDNAANEGSSCHVQVPYYIDGNTIEESEDHEEGDVGKKLDAICGKLISGRYMDEGITSGDIESKLHCTFGFPAREIKIVDIEFVFGGHGVARLGRLGA